MTEVTTLYFNAIEKMLYMHSVKLFVQSKKNSESWHDKKLNIVHYVF